MDSKLLEFSQLTDNHSPDARAKRLRLLRQKTGLNRNDFAERHNLNLSTLRSWEDGRKTGLSEKGARSLVKAFIKEGILCSTGWLLYGKGEKPKILTSECHQNPELYANKEQPEIPDEIRFFLEKNPNGVYFEMENDGMEPLYSKGDFVAGIQHFDDISNLIGEYCIVETQEGMRYARLLQAGTKDFTYNLYCINPRSTVTDPVIYNIKVISVAPIVLIRKLDIKNKSVIQS